MFRIMLQYWKVRSVVIQSKWTMLRSLTISTSYLLIFQYIENQLLAKKISMMFYNIVSHNKDDARFLSLNIPLFLSFQVSHSIKPCSNYQALFIISWLKVESLHIETIVMKSFLTPFYFRKMFSTYHVGYKSKWKKWTCNLMFV